MNLRSRYGDEQLVEKIQRGFIERHTEITKKAKKFAFFRFKDMSLYLKTNSASIE